MSWTHSLRQAPLGVLILGTLLFFAGGSLLVGGAYLAMADPAGGILVPVVAALGGAIAVYVALQFLLLRRLAWSVAIVLLILLLVYAAARAVTHLSPLPIYPLGEIVCEVAALIYLTRPGIRERFR